AVSADCVGGSVTGGIAFIGLSVVVSVVADFSGGGIGDAVAADGHGAVAVTFGGFFAVVTFFPFVHDAVPAFRTGDAAAGFVAHIGFAVLVAIVADFARFFDAVTADGCGGSVAGVVTFVGLSVIASVVAGFAVFYDAVSANGCGGSITGCV